MTQEGTPAEIFKQYVKSLIQEIVAENPNEIKLALEDVDLEDLGEVTERLKAVEAALEEIGNATRYF